MAETVLVGDIGGTNVRFALAHRGQAGKPEIEDVVILPGDAFSCFEKALQHYLSELKGTPPQQALFAFAGPVSKGRVSLTNRNWTIDSQVLADRMRFDQVRLVNDYAAMARSIPTLPETEFSLIHKGTPVSEPAPILVSGPGTGLGVATLLPDEAADWTVLTGEGGHAAYAPRTEREWALASTLRRHHGYVSKELVLSGSGLNAVHRALCEIDGVAWQETPPAEILSQARAGDPISQDICQIRAAATMDAMGDAALINGTRGGVVITGGVAERLFDWLVAPSALARFMERGPMSSYMQPIPIRLLLCGKSALIGAAALYFDQETGR